MKLVKIVSLVTMTLGCMLSAQAQVQNNKVVVVPLWSDGSTWKGSWQLATEYKRSDIVEVGGSSYIALERHTSSSSEAPGDSTFWELVAASGSDGATGPQGDPGDTGPQGATGPQGPIGLTGAPGADGADGAPGATGATGATGAPGADGADGAPGADGADGADGGGGAFGDGTAGALNITTSTNWDTSFQSNLNFTTCNIASGQTLTVPSGTVIRCTGNFTNNGTIEVLPWVGGAKDTVGSTPGISSERGQAKRAAATGTTIGLAWGTSRLRMLLNPGPEGGGNGDDGNGSPNEGGSGGGTLVVRAGGMLTNTGTIRANGGNAVTPASAEDAAGGGGGAGGIIILASASTMSNGTLEADGGNGVTSGQADDDHTGGGGGGGLIHLISSNASSVGGTISVDGGAAGPTQNTDRGSTGGTGGAMGGNGGNSSYDESSNTVYIAASAGATGVVFRTTTIHAGSLFNL